MKDRAIKEFKITENDAGQRLDRFISKAVPLLPISLAQKYIRIKRIKIGGKGTVRDYRLNTGDIVQMYINDEYFGTAGGGQEDTSFFSRASSDIDIIYQDNNIMIINKPVGLLCHNAKGEYTDTLIQRVQAYLYKNGEWHPRDSSSFTPALCNRIDRNTSGLVIAAKNAPSLRIICEKIRLGEIDKYYLAIVHGVPKPPSATLEGYIFKDAVKNRVYVKKNSAPGAKTAVMEYKTLEIIDAATALTLLECRLITGRTHQIRAQLADIGHPILGDGKYGRGDLNRKYKTQKQALCSYKLAFAFTTDAGMLSYLNKQTFKLDTEIFKNQLTTQQD